MPAPASLIRGRAWLRAVTGLGIWLPAYLALQPGWALGLLWLGALAHVPLALGLILTGQDRHPPTDTLLNLAARAQLPAALLLMVAFSAELGGIWLALPWLALTGLCGAAGAWRLVALGLRRAGALADWGLVLFAVSGAWTGASAMGWQAFGFPEVIVLLAGVHQLYAGLVLQVVAWRVVAWFGAGRKQGQSPTHLRQGFGGRASGTVPAAVTIAVSLGNLLVASGITASHLGAPTWFEACCAFFYAGCVIVLGWMQLYHALRPGSGLPLASRVLLVAADLSLGTAMTLAIIFAWGVWRGYPTQTVPQMIVWHGTLNAFGFGLCALIGWLLADTGFSMRQKKQPPAPRAES
ncbi:MAG: YndJ family transporter [Planctomycetes bacterium]|nr:YndJ family transporter [Planctomycetota bacterium]MCB9936008.1 YndJ family transporter [Planctomycetota bacterium]